ncbi:uncharacterized protein LOC133740179 isoform X2 [Rosa rugosa]|uniref:uncharacterized protein LOC133740179 isoform X2 n=1 Tax=Rosa rugosa TaxID=74645 RepID=UPI002B41122E|nr:uncharacterized protein LOC133740179 isoform X2 [Rosa rugosa]
MASKQRGSCIGGGSKWSTLFHSFSGKACISERLSMKLQNSDTQVETNLTVEAMVDITTHNLLKLFSVMLLVSKGEAATNTPKRILIKCEMSGGSLLSTNMCMSHEVVRLLLVYFC